MTILLPCLVLVAAAAAPGAAATAPSWVLGSESTHTGEISEGWLMVPAELAFPTGPTEVEIIAPAGLEAWIRQENESCEVAHSRKERSWKRVFADDELVPVCVRSSRAQKVRLLARVRLPAGAPAPRVRIVAAKALDVQSWFPWREPALAVFGALLGFLANAVFERWKKHGEAKDAVARNQAKIQRILTDGVAAELLRNYQQLRRYLSTPGQEPENVATSGVDFLLNEKRGTLGYLLGPERRAFLDKFKDVYARLNEYNDQVDAQQAERAHAAAEAALAALERPIQEFSVSPPGGPP